MNEIRVNVGPGKYPDIGIITTGTAEVPLRVAINSSPKENRRVLFADLKSRSAPLTLYLDKFEASGTKDIAAGFVLRLYTLGYHKLSPVQRKHLLADMAKGPEFAKLSLPEQDRLAKLYLKSVWEGPAIGYLDRRPPKFQMDAIYLEGQVYFIDIARGAITHEKKSGGHWDQNGRITWDRQAVTGVEG